MPPILGSIDYKHPQSGVEDFCYHGAIVPCITCVTAHQMLLLNTFYVFVDPAPFDRNPAEPLEGFCLSAFVSLAMCLSAHPIHPSVRVFVFVCCVDVCVYLFVSVYACVCDHMEFPTESIRFSVGKQQRLDDGIVTYLDPAYLKVVIWQEASDPLLYAPEEPPCQCPVLA